MKKPSSSTGLGMGNLRVRYLVARPRKTAGPLYYWLPTKRLQDAGFLPRRLDDDPIEAAKQAEDFNAKLDAWYRGEGATPKTRPDGLRALDELFQRDKSFGQLAERSKRDYLYNIKYALEWAEGLGVQSITRKAVRTWYREVSADRGPSNARNAIAALRRLLSFGKDEGWIAENPALQMRVKVPGSRERVWTLEERELFCAAAKEAARPSMALAVTIGACLGQRPADLRKLLWIAYDSDAVILDEFGRPLLHGAVRLRQAKTGKRVWVPCLPQLKAELDAAPRTTDHMVVSENTGRPYQESDFQHTFAEIREKAGLPKDLQYRDLRRTLATDLGAAGCTDDQIRSITGHKTRGVVAVYVRPDTTFAEGAMRRLTNAASGRTNGQRELKGRVERS